MAKNQTPKGKGALQGYTANKAAGRDDLTNPLDGATSKPARALNATLKPGINYGNQVRVGKNTKGTGRVGVASAVALGGKRRVSPATENPDGSRSRGGKY